MALRILLTGFQTLAVWQPMNDGITIGERLGSFQIK